MIEGVLITPLDVIDTPGGSVMHAMKKSSVGYVGFGEVYFSKIDYGAIKAWKRHKTMTLNLVVPVGEVKFVLFDDRYELSNEFQEVTISMNNYCRLTVPPMIWTGFQGLSPNESVVLNLANIQHNKLEVDKLDLSKINYKWS